MEEDAAVDPTSTGESQQLTADDKQKNANAEAPQTAEPSPAEEASSEDAEKTD